MYSFFFLFTLGLALCSSCWILVFKISFGLELFDQKKKIVTVAWHQVCALFNSGGLGLRSLESLNKATMLRLGWLLLSSQGAWASLL